MEKTRLRSILCSLLIRSTMESHELHVVDVPCPHPFDATTVVPVAIDRLGIDDQESLFRSQIVESGVSLHLAGVAATAVERQDDGQRFVKPLRSEDEVLPADPIDCDRVLNSHTALGG